MSARTERYRPPLHEAAADSVHPNTARLAPGFSNGVTTMQASKITIGDTYAVKRGGVLMRFRVTEVTTHRGSRTSSEITGYLVDDNNRVVTIGVSEVIGPYAEQAELAEKARKEKEERERIANDQKALADRLTKLFYKKTGLRRPENSSQPFRTTYSYGVEINREGVEALLKFFDTELAMHKHGV
jgi:hypothetical protein